MHQHVNIDYYNCDESLGYSLTLTLCAVTYRSIDRLGSMLNFEFILELDQQMSLLGRYLFLKYIIEFMYWARAAYIRGGVCLCSQGKISAQCAEVRAVDAESGKGSETGG